MRRSDEESERPAPMAELGEERPGSEDSPGKPGEVLKEKLGFETGLRVRPGGGSCVSSRGV